MPNNFHRLKDNLPALGGIFAFILYILIYTNLFSHSIPAESIEVAAGVFSVVIVFLAMLDAILAIAKRVSNSEITISISSKSGMRQLIKIKLGSLKIARRQIGNLFRSAEGNGEGNDQDNGDHP